MAQRDSLESEYDSGLSDDTSVTAQNRPLAVTHPVVSASAQLGKPFLIACAAAVSWSYGTALKLADHFPSGLRSMMP